MTDRSEPFRLTGPQDGAVPITALAADGLEGWLAGQDDAARTWVGATGYTAKPGKTCVVPAPDGAIRAVLLGVGADGAPWDWGGLADGLPAGTYRVDAGGGNAQAAALGWALGAYRFDRYKSARDDDGAGAARLVWPDGVDKDAVLRAAEATWLARDLINVPAHDMGPADLAAAAAALADRFGATYRDVVGDALLAENFPAIHAVGRAGGKGREPRLIDLRWGDAAAPKVTLVGKGVCFDTGGLDIKPATAMKLMKKDMGGAANMLGAALMIMDAGLPVRLRVLIPAVENSVAGDAMRPLDVVPTRSGKTVEIGHTDAEGRVILADALAEGAAEAPDLMVDFATLTGAARVALGTELPALFCDDDDFAAAMTRAGTAAADPLWRLPLWEGYRKQVDGKVADLTNAPEGGYGGAITAALFLKEFAAGAATWAHVDLMAWNVSGKPGRPEGGEAMAMRALVDAVAARYGR